jgi:hypothetical protein
MAAATLGIGRARREQADQDRNEEFTHDLDPRKRLTASLS